MAHGRRRVGLATLLRCSSSGRRTTASSASSRVYACMPPPPDFFLDRSPQPIIGGACVLPAAYADSIRAAGRRRRPTPYYTLLLDFQGCCGRWTRAGAASRRRWRRLGPTEAVARCTSPRMPGGSRCACRYLVDKLRVDANVAPHV
jgi:hypothetical protein